jgi:pimeloyl-ACP methyl ester carboxylesterase
VPGDFNCNPTGDSEVDFCAVDFCDDCPLGTTGTGSCTQPPDVLHPSGSCPYSGTLPFWGSFSSFVDEGLALKTMIANLKNATGSSKVVILAHSMGGLAARSYIQMFADQDDVDRLITIGTPHGGTPLASAISSSELASLGFNWGQLVNLLVQNVVESRSPAVQNMGSVPQSGALHLLNDTSAVNLPTSTQYVSMIGQLGTVAATLQGVYLAELASACSPIGNTQACVVLQSYLPSVNLLFESSDGLVSTDSQNLAAVRSSSGATVLPQGAQACFAIVENAMHAPFLAVGQTAETMFVDIFLRVLGLEGSAICPRR